MLPPDSRSWPVVHGAGWKGNKKKLYYEDAVLLTVKLLQDLCIMEYGNTPYAEMVRKKSITSTLIKVHKWYVQKVCSGLGFYESYQSFLSFSRNLYARVFRPWLFRHTAFLRNSVQSKKATREILGQSTPRAFLNYRVTWIDPETMHLKTIATVRMYAWLIRACNIGLHQQWQTFERWGQKSIGDCVIL